MKRVLLALVAGTVLAQPASAQQDIPLDRGMPYMQQASGMTFPPVVAGFGRSHRALRYRTDGTDESVAYRLTMDGGYVQATVYVYPSPSAAAPSDQIEAVRHAQCAAEFANVGRELMSAHPNIEMLENGPTEITQNSVLFSGEQLVLRIRAPSAFGEDHAPLRSEAHLYCFVGGRWNLKYRFTYPEALTPDVEIAAFMQELVWTIAPDAL